MTDQEEIWMMKGNILECCCIGLFNGQEDPKDTEGP